MIQLPRLFVDGQFTRFVHPVSVSITQNVIPLDTASVTLPFGEELPARNYVELFTPYGSAGFFRVRSPHDAYGQETTTAELEHAISEVGDYIVKEEISEMMPAGDAMRRIFSHYGGHIWQLGDVSAMGSKSIACEAKYDRVLDDMLALLEQMPECMMAFDFGTTPWTVSVRKKDTDVTAEGRLARNVTGATVSYDDTELCTRAWYQVFDKKKQGTWQYKDADTKGMYGVVEGTVRTSSDMTEEEIMYMVDSYLNEHKHPRISVNIQLDELCQITGEPLDKVTTGKLFRLNLVDYGVTVTENITSIVWNDVYNTPRSVNVNLGAEEDTVVTFLHNLDAKGGGGGGGGRAKDKEEEQWKEYYTQFDKQDEYIAQLAVHQDRQGKILEEAGLDLTSDGVLIYAKTSNGLYHQFDVLNNTFNSKLTNTKEGLETQIEQLEDQVNLRVKKGDVISEINLEPGTAVINSEHIQLNGTAVAESLIGKDVGIGALRVEGQSEYLRSAYFEAGLVSEENIRCNDTVVTDKLKVGGTYTASWKSATVVTNVSRSNTHRFVYSTNGSLDSLDVTWGTIVTAVDDTTIHYLGR